MQFHSKWFLSTAAAIALAGCGGSNGQSQTGSEASEESALNRAPRISEFLEMGDTFLGTLFYDIDAKIWWPSKLRRNA